jgi:hypothetical protein
MTVPTYTPEQKKAFAAHKWMSVKQAQWIFDLINTRVGIDSPDFPTWRAVYNSINSRERFEHHLKILKAMPLLTGVLAPAAKDEGTYLDPDSLQLYRVRLAKNGDRYLLRYSQAARLKRLLVTGEIVTRGKWERLNSILSRRFLTASPISFYVKAEWRMTETELTEYVTGECNFCHRPLRDGRSVKVNYGPDCAKDRGLPWGD